MSIQNVARSGEVTEAIRATVAGIFWGEAAPGVPAFELVEVYDQPNLIEALKERMLYKNRVCLVIPDRVRIANSLDGTQLRGELTRDFLVIVVDKNVGDRQSANAGGENNPGSWLLRDLVIESLHGALCGVEGVYCTIDESEPLRFRDKDRIELAKRGAEMILVSVHCGTLSDTLPPYLR